MGFEIGYHLFFVCIVACFLTFHLFFISQIVGQINEDFTLWELWLNGFNLIGKNSFEVFNWVFIMIALLKYNVWKTKVVICHKNRWWLLLISTVATIEYDRNHCLSLIPKPRLANSFGWYRHQYRNHISGKI